MFVLNLEASQWKVSCSRLWTNISENLQGEKFCIRKFTTITTAKTKKCSFNANFYSRLSLVRGAVILAFLILKTDRKCRKQFFCAGKIRIIGVLPPVVSDSIELLCTKTVRSWRHEDSAHQRQHKKKQKKWRAAVHVEGVNAWTLLYRLGTRHTCDNRSALAYNVCLHKQYPKAPLDQLNSCSNWTRDHSRATSSSLPPYHGRHGSKVNF